MKFEVQSKEENPVLARTEIIGHLSFTGPTPTRSDTIKLVASSLKAKPELTIIKKLDTHYGGDGARVTAYAYESKEQLEKVEREYMRTRNVVKEEPKPEPVQEEAPAEEAQASEEKKEDGE